MKYSVIALIGLFVCSCSQNSGVDFEDFRRTLIKIAGDGAKDCGTVEIGADQLETNTCVADAFNATSPFYAIYKVQGVDSRVARGLAYSPKQKLFTVLFDSDPSGGGAQDNGKIDTYECVNATFTGVVDADYSHLFECQ